MMRSRKPSLYLIALSLVMLTLAVTMTYLVFQAEQSLRSDARIINEAGIIRGSIQRITKLAIYDPALVPRTSKDQVNKLLQRFARMEEEYFGRGYKTETFLGVNQLRLRWQALETSLENFADNPSADQSRVIIEQSEHCWVAAVEMVLLAQKATEKKILRVKVLLYFMLVLNIAAVSLVIAILVIYVRRKLERESVRDHLTNLYNRRMYDHILDSEIARASRYQSPLSLLLLDLDHFKRINDEFGHKGGDQVLVDLAWVMKSSIRETDRLFRIGGEEFAIICPGLSGEVALQMAEKLRHTIESHTFPVPRVVTASIGVAQYTPEKNADSLYQAADKALYDAKGRGRNCSVVAGEWAVMGEN